MNNKKRVCNDCEYAEFNEARTAYFCENINSPVQETYNNHVTGCYACGEFKHRIALPAIDNETVYCIMPNVDTDIHEVFIVTIEKSYTHKDGIKFLGIMDDVDDWECDLSEFGKTVFRTREEAKNALDAIMRSS